MIFKTVFFAFLLVGVFADDAFQLSDEKREQMKSLLRAQCKKVGAEDKIDDVTNAAHAFVDCVKGLFNIEELKKEIEDAKPNGALDEVFKKYCAKTPQLKTCIHTLMDGVSPCIDPSVLTQFTSAKNGTDQLIDFVCYKDGDRIALFISEQGPECFKEKINTIRDCGNTVRDSVPNEEAAKQLTLSEQCAKFDQVSSCIVSALETCTTPTPGNMAESLFRYVRKGSPCNSALPKN